MCALMADSACVHSGADYLPDAGVSFAAYGVVSVKPVHPGGMPSPVYRRPNGIDGESVTVVLLVRSSYVKGNFPSDDVIIGLPDWTKTDYFSLQAKMSPEQVAAFARLDTNRQRACQDAME